MVSSNDIGQDRSRTVGSTIRSFVAALAVNAAIVLSAPRSTPGNPTPIVMRMTRALVNDRWHEGELIDGHGPCARVVIVPLCGRLERDGLGAIISNN